MNKDQSTFRNSMHVLIGLIVGGLMTAALGIVLARVMGPTVYGIFALALSLAALLAIPADLGLTQAAARFVSERRDNYSQARHVIGRALKVKVAISLAVAILLFLLAGPIASAYGIEAMAPALRVASLVVVGQSFYIFLRAIFLALGRSGRMLTMSLSESVIELTGSILLVVIVGGATSAMAGRAIGFISAALLGSALALRLFLGNKSQASGVASRDLLTYAGAMVIIDASFVAFTQIDVLIIGALLGPSQAGIFEAALRAVAGLSYPAYAVAAAAAPRITSNNREAGSIASSALALMVFIQVIVVVVSALVVVPLLPLILGQDYRQSSDVLLALIIYLAIINPVTFLSLAANYLGEGRRRIPATVALLVSCALLDYLFIKTIGLLGAAAATTLTFAAYGLFHWRLLNNRIKLDKSLLKQSLVKAVLSVLPIALVLIAAERLIDPLGLLALSIPLTGCYLLLARGNIAPLINRLRS